MAMDTVAEEAVRRKKRKQKKLRMKWIMKKKEKNLSHKENQELDIFEDEKELAMNVDQDIQAAQARIKEWLARGEFSFRPCCC